MELKQIKGVFPQNVINGLVLAKLKKWLICNKIAICNWITFKIRTGYCLEHLSPKKMKLLGSTKSKTAKDKNG